MNCKYTYKNGRTFDSELALDDFLLHTEKYNLATDEVFSLSTKQHNAKSTIQRRAHDAEKVISHYPVMLDTELFEDYTLTDFPPGTTAVTAALKAYRNGNDRLFPEFDLQNYWTHKLPNWNILDYWTVGTTNSKGEFIRADDLEIKAVFGDIRREDITKVPMPDQIENGKKIIEKMWACQGFMGTGVHRMIAAYWSVVAQHGNNYQDAIDKALDFYLVKDTTNDRLKPFEGIKYSEIIPASVKNNILSQCKEIHERLKQEFMTDPNDPNEELLVLPEIAAVTEIDDFTNPNGGKINLVGNFDLLVVDKDGNINVIDYKTSPKEYNDYNSAKKRTFYYQLATYQRMVERMGFNLGHKSNVYVIPIKFEGFTLHPEEDDLRKLVSFNGLSLRSSDILERLDIKSGPDADTINANLDEFIPLNNVKPKTDGEILAKTKEFIEKKFPVFGKANEITSEYVIKRLKKKGADKMNPNTRNYLFKMGKKLIEGSTFEELVDKVLKEYLKTEEHLQDRTIGIKSIIQDAIKNGKVEIKAGHSNRKYSKEGWMEDTLKRYANGNYEIMEDYKEDTERLGIILLKNIHTNKIDVLVCDASKRDFDDEILLGGDLDTRESRRKTLTGTFINDIDAKNKPQELVMDSTYGNIRLMEVLAAINQMEDLFAVGDSKSRPVLGEVTLFNQYHNEGWSAPNEQLMYNFKELNTLDGTEKDINFGKTIRVAKYLDLVKHQATEILMTQKDSRWDGLKSAVDATQDFQTNPLRLKAELTKLAHNIEDKWRLTNDTNARNLEGDRAEAYRFLVNLYSAIAELNGINFKQLITDHDDFLNQKGILDALRNGWSGNRLDNPGMLDSDTLNKIGKQLNNAYQNTRDEIKVIAKKVFELSEKLKKEKNFGYVLSRTFGNEASLYRNMYDESIKDDLYFKNPFDDNTMSNTEKEYLKYSLFMINKNRYGILTMEELQEAIFDEDGLKYLRVPLTQGSDASKIAYKGMAETIKEKFQKLIPTLENIREVFRGLLVDSDLIEDEAKRNKYRDKNAELWEMNTEFDAGEYDEARRVMMSERGKNYFEHDLELLTMKHCYAYILKDNINGVFPILKACALQLEMLGVIMNTRFAEDIQYLHDFITAKVLNMSIQDPKWEQFSYVAGKLMSGASKLALAFNPRQWYQAIDGLWKDISLIIRKPDGTYAFNQEHMRKAFIWAYSDMTHNWGDSKSLGQYLNELYGINDMDMNTYINKIKPNQFGFFNFGNMMFHFASRPDYYNRMTIFGAHMMADGCFEAHDENGNYDWTKDKRYDIFAKYCKNESDVPDNLKKTYNELKARYIAVAKLFQAEGAKYVNENGETVDFELDLKNPIPLPRAYTVQEAESIKSLSDLVYGYYSHEKKSLIQSTTAGALFMQMNTYWSSKKNQWFAPGGVRMMGKMVHYSERQPDGSLKYYFIDEKGEPTEEDTGVPFMVWQGLYQEGIMVTLASVLHDAYFGDENGNKGLGNAIDKYWNVDDENLRTAYRNNLKQFAFDTTAFLFLGMITAPALETAVTAVAKEAGNGDLGTALINNTMVNLASMFSTSTDDFNMTKSVFGRGIQWTPFSLTTLTSTYSRISSAISGNSDWYDSLVKLAAATRTQECLFDCIKINTLGRKIGQAA